MELEITWTRFFEASKILRFFVLFFWQMTWCFSIRSSAKFRLQIPHLTSPSGTGPVSSSKLLWFELAALFVTVICRVFGVGAAAVRVWTPVNVFGLIVERTEPVDDVTLFPLFVDLDGLAGLIFLFIIIIITTQSVQGKRIEKKRK